MMGITFYPTISCGEFGKYVDAKCVLLPASSWAGSELRRRGTDEQGMVRAIPVPNLTVLAGIEKKAADCGGFVATRKWGRYLYTPEQYVAWIQAWSPDWAATMDYCCEDEITSGRPGVVCERQRLTTEMAYHFWTAYRDASWAWVPTVQGWEVEDYRRHVRELKPLILEMQAYYQQRDGEASEFRVGIGTLCARASSEMIRKVVSLVADELGEVPLHLWGVKLGVFKSPVHLPHQVTSVDSGAWNGMWGHDRNLWKATPYTQREWCFKVALPSYEAKIQKALAQPKQMSLFMKEVS